MPHRPSRLPCCRDLPDLLLLVFAAQDLEAVARAHHTAAQDAAEDAFLGHDAGAHQISDFAALVTGLANLGELQKDVLSYAEACPYGVA